MDERASDVLLKERAGESGEEMEGAREGGSGRAGSRGTRAALRMRRGSDKAGDDGNTDVGNPERGKVGVAGIHGVREIENGRPPFWCQGYWEGGQERRAESRGKGRDGRRGRGRIA